MGSSYPQAVKLEVMRRYLSGERPSEIEQHTVVSVETIKHWATKYDWVKKRKALVSEAEETILEECRQMVLANKLDVMAGDLEMSAALRDAIKKKLIDDNGNARDLKPRDLDSLAKAAKNASDIGTRIVGISGDSAPKGNTVINVGTMGGMKSVVGESDAPF